jgi:tetratricopeptide (TPR) repeat protein
VPDNALERALGLRRAGRLDEAVIALESLLVDEPRNGLALAHLAQLQLRRGRPDQALAELDRAEAAAGTTAFTAHVRGDALYRLGRHADAARAYEDALALGDRGSWPLVQLARCRIRLRDLPGARDAGSRAVERDPDSAAGWTVLGEVAAAEDDLAQAEAMYARAHECDPEDQYAYARLVRARLLQLPPEKRTREVKVLLKTGGRDNSHLLGVLAQVQRELGDETAAAEAWRRSGDRAAGGDLFARKQEGYARRRAGDLEGAAHVLRDCLLRAPQDVILFKTYVGLERQRGATDELKQTLQELLPVAGPRRGAVYAELRRLEHG